MKTLALYPIVISLSASTLFGQSQSDIDFLRARADAQERKISQLESELSRLKAFHAEKPAADKTATAHKATPPKAIPVEESSVAVSSPLTGGNYAVQKGDTLTRIAHRHGTSVEAVMRENNLRSDIIRVGQKLRIPTANAPAAAQPAPAPEPAPAQLAKHTVKSGDTFYSIARDYKVSVNSLMASNPEIEPTSINVGQTLVIDGNARSATKAGTSMANTEQSVAQQSAKSRDLASNASSGRASAQSSASGSKPAIRTITVNEQITYGQFATRYGSSTNQLNALNGLSLTKSTMLAKGSELYVPKY